MGRQCASTRTTRRPYCLRSRTLVRERQFERALGDLDQALRLNPRDAKTHQSRAAVYAASGDQARAIEDYSAAIRFDPHYALAYQGRGDAYARTGRPELALQDYSEVIRLSRTTPMPTTAGGWSWREQAIRCAPSRTWTRQSPASRISPRLFASAA